MIEAWNNHHIARKGISNALHASNCCINWIHSLEMIQLKSIVDNAVPSPTHVILGRIL